MRLTPPSAPGGTASAADCWPCPGTRAQPGGRASSLRLAGALALFVGLAALHTWPLASAPGAWSRNDNGDALLNEWAVAWVAHQLPRDPIHLFDANIFYPERRTLAFSEHLLVQSVLVAPVRWLGGSPVLAHNLSLLAGLVLTAWAMAFCVTRWTGSPAAGLVAGSLAAFNAHSLTQLAHLQAQHVEFLPLALLALDRLLVVPRVRHALALGTWFALQALTSIYFLLFTAVAMVAAVAVRPADWWGRRFRRTVPCLLAAGGIAAAWLLPVLVAYWTVRRDHTVVRTLGEAELFSAGVRDYLSTGAWLHWGWSRHLWTGNGFFPGITALALTCVAVVSRVAWRDGRARMWLGVAAATFALSLGTHLPFYAWLFQHVPLFDGIRAVNRFGQYFLVAIAALAGFGAAWLLARVRSTRRARMLGLLLLVLVNAEAWRGPLQYTPFTGVPRIFRTLASVPGAVVVYVPFYWFSGEIGLNGQYMLASTENWKPMLNGYSGFAPRSFLRSVEAMRSFPDDASLRYLRGAGVTHVVVDARGIRADKAQQIGQAEALRRWAADGRYTIYTIGASGAAESGQVSR